MSRLFIQLYLDEDVATLVSLLIRSRGFDATTAREEGQLHNSDAEQLAYAVERGRTLVTHNRVDFQELARQYLAAGRRHAGIIISVRRSPYEIARRLVLILNDTTNDEMENQLLYI